VARDSPPQGRFWQLTIAELERELGSSADGISSVEAASRRIRYGPNVLDRQRRLSLPLRFLSRFRNPLVLVLLVAAAISALTGDLASFVIISTIVLVSAALDTYPGIPRRAGRRTSENIGGADGTSAARRARGHPARRPTGTGRHCNARGR
jgi:hypothetical protein